MTYVKQTWNDGVTPVDAAHMSYIENGIALHAPAYATTLPASPADGQEAILVDSVTSPSWQWRFRYNAGSSWPHKWEFVGGVPWTSYVDAADTTTSPSLVEPATPQRFTAPRAGTYLLYFVLEAGSTIAADTLVAQLAAPCYGQVSVPNGSVTLAKRAFAEMTAGQVIPLQFARPFGSGTGSIARRYIEAIPVRVA